MQINQPEALTPYHQVNFAHDPLSLASELLLTNAGFLFKALIGLIFTIQ